MTIAISLHPSVQLGVWLKAQRRLRDYTKRAFAERISLSAARYTEVEAGITHWVGHDQQAAIINAIERESEQNEFRELLTAARNAEPLSFDKVFSREQLMPMRGHCEDDRPLTREVKERLLNQIFEPLT